MRASYRRIEENFTAVRQSLLSSTKLSDAEKLLKAKVEQYELKYDKAFAFQKTFAEELGWSEQKTKRVFGSLSKMGYIEKARAPRSRGNYYKSVPGKC